MKNISKIIVVARKRAKRRHSHRRWKKNGRDDFDNKRSIRAKVLLQKNVTIRKTQAVPSHPVRPQEGENLTWDGK